MSITLAFEENGQLTSKHKGGVPCPMLQDKHTQWLVERIHVDPSISVESLNCQLNEIFLNSQALYLSIVFQKPFEVKLYLPLKLMPYKPYDFNNDEQYFSTSRMTYKQSLQT